MLHLAVEDAFDHLLATWRAHENNQMSNASLPVLAASRQQLDLARTRMHSLRVAIYPESGEQESIVESVWCESLEIVVHLRWTDRDADRPGNFRCACGHLVPVDWERLEADRSRHGSPSARQV